MYNYRISALILSYELSTFTSLIVTLLYSIFFSFNQCFKFLSGHKHLIFALVVVPRVVPAGGRGQSFTNKSQHSLRNTSLLSSDGADRVTVGTPLSTFRKHFTKCPTSCHAGTVTHFGSLVLFPCAPESWLRLEKTSWKLGWKTGNLIRVRFLDRKTCSVCFCYPRFQALCGELVRRESYAQGDAHWIYE